MGTYNCTSDSVHSMRVRRREYQPPTSCSRRSDVVSLSVHKLTVCRNSCVLCTTCWCMLFMSTPIQLFDADRSDEPVEKTKSIKPLCSGDITSDLSGRSGWSDLGMLETIFNEWLSEHCYHVNGGFLGNGGQICFLFRSVGYHFLPHH